MSLLPEFAILVNNFESELCKEKGWPEVVSGCCEQVRALDPVLVDKDCVQFFLGMIT